MEAALLAPVMLRVRLPVVAVAGVVAARLSDGGSGRSLMGSMRWKVCGSLRSRWRSTSDVFEPFSSSRPAKMSLCSCTSGCSGCAVVRTRLMSATVPATGTVSLSGSSVALDGDLITSSKVAMGALKGVGRTFM